MSELLQFTLSGLTVGAIYALVAIGFTLLTTAVSARASGPEYGLYYDQREPTFYTGFAPRTLDPARLHLHVGRGNQLRVTVVLADDVLAEYARDLVSDAGRRGAPRPDAESHLRRLRAAPT